MSSRVGGGASPTAFLGVGPGYGTEVVPVRFVGDQDVISRTDSASGRGLSITEADKLDIQPDGVNR